MSTKMAYEGQIFIGTAGSTASGQLVNFTDANVNLETEMGDTTVTGDGSAPPIKTERVTQRSPGGDFTMLNKTGDTLLQTLLTAVYAGAPVALREKDYAAGKGFDGDVNLKVSKGRPFNGNQTLQFTWTANDELRAPSLYV